jgi:hypothetical protein
MKRRWCPICKMYVDTVTPLLFQPVIGCVVCGGLFLANVMPFEPDDYLALLEAVAARGRG